MTRTRSPLEQTPVGGNGRVEVPALANAPMLPPPRRRRRPALLALAVVLMVLGALGASFVATSLGRTSSVIAVAYAVPRGQELTAADLVEARITADTALAPIPYADRDKVIGMIAATDLTAGSLLTSDALTADRFPPPGSDLVGVGVKQAQLPASPLRPGDDVLLVPVATGNGSAAGSGVPAASVPRAIRATVARVGATGVDGLRVVDVLVDAADGPDVAARAAAGLLVIVVVAGE
jgi:hypothetical protein